MSNQHISDSSDGASKAHSQKELASEIRASDNKSGYSTDTPQLRSIAVSWVTSPTTRPKWRWAIL